MSLNAAPLYCPHCGRQLILGRAKKMGYALYSGEPIMYTPLLCPVTQIWWRRILWPLVMMHYLDMGPGGGGDG